MNGFLLAASLLVFGMLFDSWWLSMTGVAGLFIALIYYYVEARKSVLAAPAGGRPTHKVIQAPDNAWENDDAMSYVIGMSGLRAMPMSNMDDPFRAISKGFESKDQLVARDVARNFLPLSNYGRQTVFEHVFIGLPINIGTLIKKR
jgi:hypothetical protein